MLDSLGHFEDKNLKTLGDFRHWSEISTAQYFELHLVL